MIILTAIVAGALFGWFRAKRRGGDRLDRLQYAAAHAIAFGLGSVVMIILVQRLAGG